MSETKRTQPWWAPEPIPEPRRRPPKILIGLLTEEPADEESEPPAVLRRAET